MDGFVRWLKRRWLVGALLATAVAVWFAPKLLAVAAFVALAYYLYRNPGATDF